MLGTLAVRRLEESPEFLRKPRTSWGEKPGHGETEIGATRYFTTLRRTYFVLAVPGTKEMASSQKHSSSS